MTAFPDCVPVLVAGSVRLRAHRETDLTRIVEQCQDPETLRWTTTPRPYTEVDGREFLALITSSWLAGRPQFWAIEADGIFVGTIDLRFDGPDAAEIGYGLHPDGRGRGIMTTAAKLLRDHAFDDLGLDYLHWRAAVGNSASRRVAEKVGITVEGQVRGLHRRPDGVRLDRWLGSMTRQDPRP